MTLPVQTDAEIAAFFDRCAAERLMVDFPEQERTRLREFLAHWDLRRGMRVLEPGCGSGRLTAELAPRVGPRGEVYACDLSPGMLAIALSRELPPQARLSRESVLDNPRPDHWFDRILCLNVFPHFRDRLRVLRTFARLLHPSGRLWINHFEGSASLNRFHREAGAAVADHALPCAASMEALLEASGFRIVQFVDRDDCYLLEAALAG